MSQTVNATVTNERVTLILSYISYEFFALLVTKPHLISNKTITLIPKLVVKMSTNSRILASRFKFLTTLLLYIFDEIFC